MITLLNSLVKSSLVFVLVEGGLLAALNFCFYGLTYISFVLNGCYSFVVTMLPKCCNNVTALR